MSPHTIHKIRVARVWACEREPESLWACERELFLNFKTGGVPMTVDLEGLNFWVYRVFLMKFEELGNAIPMMYLGKRKRDYFQ